MNAQPTATDRLASERQVSIAAEFDAWAPKYENGRLARWYKMHAREVFKHLDLSGAQRVLDIGCGTGWALRQLAAQYPQVEFVGIDLSTGMIAEASRFAEAQGLANISFCVGDWEQVGPKNADDIHRLVAPGFDLILCFSSLHYMADLEAALASIRDYLYDDGKLVLVERDTQGSTLTQIWGALHKFVLKDGVEFIDAEELLRMMRLVGFAPVRPLFRKQQLLRHGKLFTSVIAIEGGRSFAAD